MSISDNPVYAPEVIAFVKSASEYCQLIEQADTLELKDFVDKTHKLLPQLYISGINLPLLDAKFEEFNQRFVSEQDYEYIRTKLLGKLEQYDSYEEVYTPLNEDDHDQVGASISEDLTDIYQDIKDFILLYEIGSNEVMYEAIWECRQAFETYWGQRLTNAQRALHFLRYSDEEILEQEDFEVSKDETSDDINTDDWIISRRMKENDDDEQFPL